MGKIRITAILLLVAGLAVGYFVYSSEVSENARYPIKYGLDLQGGTHLVYDADVSDLQERDVDDAMQSLRSVIEERINVFGVSEPVVQVERGGFGTGEVEHRLIIELPGITDVEEATELIGRTPELEFRLVNENVPMPTGTSTPLLESERFEPIGLTGRLLERAQLDFGSPGGGGLTNEPLVIVHFNREGAELFAEVTSNNVGRQLAIFLDGRLLSSPVIQQSIVGGTAQITGNFTPEEARTLVRDLNLGALPVPIELVSTQTIGPTLGHAARDAGVKAGVIGLALVGLFLLLWYRMQGAVAVVALGIYLVLMLALFKLIPVVLTAAGIAGFILSIGMAVDANILIFERIKEEIRDGAQNLEQAIRDGFSRAWPSIRDANISSMISAVILFWLGTSLVKGFAVTFGIGVLVSMITAISVSRTFLLAVAGDKPADGTWRRLFKTGFGNVSHVLSDGSGDVKDAND